MIAALRSEWVKLRTIRMNWVLVIIAFAFPFIVTVLVMSLSDIEELNATDTVGGIAGFSVITAMLLGVVGAATITSEFGFGTIRVTFAAEPRRWVVLVAKAIVTVVVSAVLAAITIGVVLARRVADRVGAGLSAEPLGEPTRVPHRCTASSRSPRSSACSGTGWDCSSG